MVSGWKIGGSVLGLEPASAHIWVCAIYPHAGWVVRWWKGPIIHKVWFMYPLPEGRKAGMRDEGY